MTFNADCPNGHPGAEWSQTDALGDHGTVKCRRCDTAVLIPAQAHGFFPGLVNLLLMEAS